MGRKFPSDMKRFLSLMLALILCFSLVTAAFAAEGKEDVQEVTTTAAPKETTAPYEPEGEDEPVPSVVPEVTPRPSESDDWLIICLDPGHGSTDPGACATYNGVEYHEADLVLKIAQYLKADLEEYRDVLVVMTREDNDGDPEVINPKKIAPRVEYAAEMQADVLVSLHLNASTNKDIHGAMMLDSNGNYNSGAADVAYAIGANILTRLSALGLVNRGHLPRNSQDYKNPDGSVADYYGIVRGGMWRNLPAFIVEHCFITSEEDFKGYLNTDKKLAALAQADAEGIAAYYGLVKKDGTEPVDPVVLLDYENHWAKDNIDTAIANGWINGYPDHSFKPNKSLTRADFVTMLARVSGEELPEIKTSPFPDFGAEMYYAQSVQWAVDAGIINGFEDGTFGPMQSITREQMAHIMAQYLKHKGFKVEATTDVTQKLIKDFKVISDYAKADVCFCYEKSLLNGREDGFAPAEGATRAEACTVLLRLNAYTLLNDPEDEEVPEETPAPAESPEPTESPKPEISPAPETTPEVTESPAPAETPAATPEVTPAVTESPAPTESPKPAA